jgi:phospholipid/cholesterol/gamma-HCH transport system permease protein
VTGIGALALRLIGDVGALALLFGHSCMLLVRGRVDGREWVRHLSRFLFGSLAIVMSGSVVVGGVVAMQGLNYVSRYSAREVFGWAVGLSSFRDVAPLLLGFTIAARLGTKNAAELATLSARERIDAIEALGLDADETVVAPRLWAIAAASAVLYPFATTTVLLSSFLVAWGVGDQPLPVSWWSLTTYMHASIALQGMERLVAFGVLVGTVSCHFGQALRAPGAPRDARAIGRAVFSSSVASMCGIVVLNLYLSFIGGTS